jgi:dTDP-glucose 4,6-dehydratase
VTDLVDGIFRLLFSDYHLPVNCGNPAEITIKEFADEILRHTGSKSEIVYRPLPPDDPKQRKPDITLARTKLDWTPKVALEEGLVTTLEYFRTKVR